MKRYELIKKFDAQYPEDVRAIRDQLESIGIMVSLQDAHAAWNKYSNSASAGWLMLYDDPWDTWNAISIYFEETL